ncbi:hypothetical protein HK096_001646, partial [Nowakowskiella sp. JEL0078]
MSHNIVLSPNEQKFLFSEKNKNLRLTRLKEVEKAAAEYLRNKVKHSISVQWGKVIDNARIQWEEEKKKKLESLMNTIEQAQSDLGISHENAEIEREKLSKHSEEFKKKQSEFDILEFHRSGLALQELQSEKHEQNLATNMRLQSLHRSKLQEKQRSQKVISQKTPPCKPSNFEFQSQPLVKRNMEKKKFESTNFHRNYVAVRCEGTEYNAIEMAKTVEQRNQKKDLEKKNRILKLQALEEVRFQKASNDAKMET